VRMEGGSCCRIRPIELTAAVIVGARSKVDHVLVPCEGEVYRLPAANIVEDGDRIPVVVIDKPAVKAALDLAGNVFVSHPALSTPAGGSLTGRFYFDAEFIGCVTAEALGQGVPLVEGVRTYPDNRHVVSPFRLTFT